MNVDFVKMRVNLLTFIEKTRKYFCIFFLLFTILRLVNLYKFLPSYINIFLFGCLSIFAFIAAFLNFFCNFKDQNKTLILFWVVILISSLLKIKYGFIDNTKELIWYTINFFLIYPNKNNNFFLIKNIKKITIISLFLISFLSILIYIIQINFYIDFPLINKLSRPDPFRFGFIENRLFGLYSNPNPASNFILLSILFSIEELIENLNLFHRSKFSFYFNIICIITQLIYIILSSSRSTMTTMIFIVFIFSLAFIKKIIKHKKFSNETISILLCVILSFFCCFCFYISTIILKKLLSFIPYLFYKLIIRSNSSIGEINTKRIDWRSHGDISNLRFKIWISAFEIFKTTWLFGTSPRNLVPYALDTIPRTFMAELKYQTVHNVYIGVFVYTGITGALFFYSFIMNKVTKLIKLLFKFINDINSIYLKTKTTIFILVSIAIFGMFEPGIVFSNNALTFMLWIFLNDFSEISKKYC